MYTVGDAPFPVLTTNVQVKAPTDGTNSNTGLRVCDTTTQLYRGTAVNAETTSVTTTGNTWTSSDNSDSCIFSMDSVRFGFNLYCTNNAKYAFTGG